MAKRPLPLGTPGAEGKDGGDPLPAPSGPAYSLMISKRIVTTTRMVFSME
jgi:hypothetical protein